MPWVVIAVCLLALIGSVRPTNPSSELLVEDFAKLPVSYKGRVKPMDTVARNVLLILSNRQTLKHEGRHLRAIDWLLDVLARPSVAEGYRMFRIGHPEIPSSLGLDQSHMDNAGFALVSAAVLRTSEVRDRLIHQFHLANQVPQQQRSPFQRKLIELANHLTIYEALTSPREPFLVPPVDQESDWMSMADAVRIAQATGTAPAGAQELATMLMAYADQDSKRFNESLAGYETVLRRSQTQSLKKARLETFFNRYNLFFKCQLLYLLAILLSFFSWLGWNATLRRTAVSVVTISIILHSLGLITRIYLSGRPPVTNLYSTALFIGWAGVIASLLIELLYRNGIATLLAAAIGALTLQLAWALTGDGDTMAVLVAVLDTNFWLATHVVVINIGYAATYLAGFLGIMYIIRGVLTKSQTPTDSRKMAQMLYGIICFAVLFSFVGTILGGIWADQSWGRFWGWDPKENGAVLIVLWNVLMLHARWGGIVRQRGLAAMAVFGNIVTSWSYFGTNMLGVGLHAYGFIDAAALWLFTFIFIQLLFINLAMQPPQTWASQPYPVNPTESPSITFMARLFVHGVFSGLFVMLIGVCMLRAMAPTTARTIVVGSSVLIAAAFAGMAGFRVWRQSGALSNLAGVPVGACVYYPLATMALP